MAEQLRLESSDPGRAAGDDPERARYRERLRQHLQDPTFRALEGFPLGSDEAILALSDPPYYTACPNPFLPEILERWRAERAELRARLGLPDDSSDNGNGGAAAYHREPFAADVSEGKNDPIYNAHSYHTKVPHRAIMRYILHYTEPGDVVFDGFCGTGMTGVAAQLCADRKTVESLGYRVDEAGVVYEGSRAVSRLGPRKAALVDLSPAATFIAYNYNTPVDVAAFEREAKRILAEVDAECGWMYETWHPHCDHPDRVKGRINYTVWSDVFLCPACGAELAFWDVAVDKTTGQVQEAFGCSGCSARLTKTDLERASDVSYRTATGEVIREARRRPVLIDYSEGRSRYKKIPDANDLGLTQRIDQNESRYWYPVTRIDRDIDIWYERDYRSLGMFSVDSFYTKRNLALLAALWNRTTEVMDYRVRNALKFAITGMQVNLSRMNRWRANVSFPYNPLSGTLYVSALQSESNVLIGVANKITRLTGTWHLEGHLVAGNTTISAQSSCTGIASITPDSIDYVFIDPPFGSNIIYSDLSLIWESWLATYTSTDHETVVHRRKKTNAVTLDMYRSMMSEGFSEAYRILKPGRWMTVEFHNSQNSVWNAIQEGILRAGFVVADVRSLDKQLGTFKQVSGGIAVKQDLIISAYKPTASFERHFLEEAGTAEGAWDFVRQHLAKLPVVVEKKGALESVAERQAYLLFDRMVAFHIQRGATVPLSAAELYAGLKQRFVERDGMFFLPDQAPAYDRARLEAGGVKQLSLFVSDEKSARLWLQQQLDPSLGGKPQTYQEIQPQFLRNLVQARHEALPELLKVLEQGFLQDEAGRWYTPDPARAADLERLRLRALLQEFSAYADGSGRLRRFRTEAVRAGFADAYRRRDFAAIVRVAERLPETVLQEDPDLLMYYDNASLRVR